MTWEQADTERYVGEAVASGTVDAVVAAGGDGTVNEVSYSQSNTQHLQTALKHGNYSSQI